MTDKWAEHKQKFCGCKDASRLNRCQGRNNCELPEGHPERVIATPRQPEGEGLEVVDKIGTFEIPDIVATFDGLYLIPVKPLNAGDHLMAISQHRRMWQDAQRAIAELREECERLRESQKNYFTVTIQHGAAVAEAQAERDALRQQLAERDAQIERLQMQLAACVEHVYCFPDCKSAHEAVSKEQAVLLWYEGFRSEPIPVLEAWEAIGHDIGCNPSKQELLDSLRNMAAICEAHGNDMPKPAQHARDSAELRRLCSERDHLKACQENAQLHITGLVAERNAALRQRDKLAELLREAKSAYTAAIHWTDMRATMVQIDTALSELTQ